ncbi:OmpA family protein [Opitutus sp. ER46]|uniref:OmpA family protein n=1 Tax=Opitutus sp. ER46 TaxID=2161864 RepID=UPI000D315DD1|nr:OmpA family protein [Opitutus sp. ER46]PTX99061.1 flagellar motor protein MotB [Opitutus sp. ER46]
MNLPSKSLCLVVASAMLVFAGCTKKPARPDPSATAMGPQGAGAGLGSVSPTDLAGNTSAGGELQQRDAGFDANGQNRAALADQTVYFDYDSSSIKSAERAKLQAAKDYLDKNAGQRLLLEGRCDWRGTAEYNLALGDRRANSVKKYLQSLGVPADRIETLSKGSLEAAKNADEATMAKDRRVDLIVVQAAGALPAAGAPAAAPASAPAAGAVPPL